MVQERLHREAQSRVAHPAGADGLAQHARARRCRQQRRRPGRPRHVGVLGRGRGAAHRRLPAAEQRQPERQLSPLAGAQDHGQGERGDAEAPAAPLRRQGPGRGPAARRRGKRGQPRAPRHGPARQAADGELPFRPARDRGDGGHQGCRDLHDLQRHHGGRSEGAGAARRRRDHRPGHRGRRPSRHLHRRGHGPAGRPLRPAAANRRCRARARHRSRRCIRWAPGGGRHHAGRERRAARHRVPALRGSQRAGRPPYGLARGERQLHGRHRHDHRQAGPLHAQQAHGRTDRLGARARGVSRAVELDRTARSNGRSGGHGALCGTVGGARQGHQRGGARRNPSPRRPRAASRLFATERPRPSRPQPTRNDWSMAGGADRLFRSWNECRPLSRVRAPAGGGPRPLVGVAEGMDHHALRSCEEHRAQQRGGLGQPRGAVLRGGSAPSGATRSRTC